MSLAIMLAGISWTAPARASDEEEDDEVKDRWLPSLAFSFGAYSQQIGGTTTSSSAPVFGRPADSLITEILQFDGRLDSPVIVDSAWAPRVFLTAGVQIPLAEGLIAERRDRSFDRGSPGFAAFCPNNLPGPSPPPITNPNLEASTCALAVRNRVTLDAMWFTGIGIDITLPLLENQFHIAPAFEYYGYQVQTVGDLVRKSAGLNVDDLEELGNTVGDPEVYHGVSPSLTLSVDVVDERPWKWSVFLTGRAVFLLTDPLTQAESQLPGTTFTFTTSMSDFVYQGTAGFRIQWTGGE